MSFNKLLKIFKNRKYISIFVLCILELGALFLMYKTSNNRNLDEVSLKHDKNNDMFAIFLEDDEGNYNKSESNKWPNDRYKFSATKSGCVNNQGKLITNILDYNSDSKVVTLKTNKSSYCYLYFDMLNDLTINVSTDGVEGSIPETLGYTKTINCNNGSAPIWNYKYNRLELGDIFGDEEECNLTYTKDTNSYTTLRDTVENDDEIVHEIFYDLTADAIFTKLETVADYGTVTNTSAKPFVFDETNKKYILSTADNSAAMTYFKFYPKEDGYYQICYELPSTQSTSTAVNNNNYLAFYTLSKTSGVTMVKSNISNGETVTGCYTYGYVSTNDFIYIRARRYDNDISFYAQKTDSFDVTDAGYRYEGFEPNNYIWFNNEMWQIIGSIPTKKASDGKMENLVKIIRTKNIGSIAYDAKSENDATGICGDNTLHRLLNNYYFGKKDATNTQYCYSYKTERKTKCNYSINGINPNDNYGKMVEKVYLNNGRNGWFSSYNAKENYIYEIANREITAFVEVMNASDYGFAMEQYYHTLDLGDYSDWPDSNWLALEPTYIGLGRKTYYNNTYTTIGGSHDIVRYDGSVGTNYAYSGSHVKPTLFLKKSVYVIGGDGTETNPYQIAM